MEHHALRVHEYGECCELYPCEKCGFRDTKINAIHSCIKNFHGSSEETTNDITLEDTDIEALPVNSKRKKQNLDGLVMDDEESIDVEESDDEYNDKDNTEKLLAEDEYDIIGSKQQTTEKSKFECDVCKSCFMRKDNLHRL